MTPVTVMVREKANAGKADKSKLFQIVPNVFIGFL
jgi:hypothetical protein